MKFLQRKEKDSKTLIQNKIKALLMEYAPSCINPNSLDNMSETEKLVYATSSVFVAITEHNPNAATDLAEKVCEAVNEHKLADAIRKFPTSSTSNHL